MGSPKKQSLMSFTWELAQEAGVRDWGARDREGGRCVTELLWVAGAAFRRDHWKVQSAVRVVCLEAEAPGLSLRCSWSLVAESVGTQGYGEVGSSTGQDSEADMRPKGGSVCGLEVGCCQLRVRMSS